MTLPTSLHQTLAPGAQRLMDAFRFVLVAPSHPGNIGSVARAMKTMGLSDLVVAAPREPRFMDHPQARALASGAVDLLARAASTGTLREAVADCQLVVAVSANPREFGPWPRLPAEVAACAIERLDAGIVERVALVFGTERTGLSIEEMGLCQQLVCIPADPTYSSLNLSQAAQIVAFSLRQEVMRSTRGAGDGDAPRRRRRYGEAHADHASVERLFEHLERMLVAIDYLDPAEPRRLLPRLRRLLARTTLEAAEVDLLRGICTQMEKMAARARREAGEGARRGEGD
ncbi:MAG: RNA methyltransferase [Burkholderiaceae bacterium]|nr:RNA methyltransferase [Burkholderiaceae bacterium]